ncbi:MAG: hypothetical protein ACPGUV_07405 [Polyangiales bacterium]
MMRPAELNLERPAAWPAACRAAWCAGMALSLLVSCTDSRACPPGFERAGGGCQPVPVTQAVTPSTPPCTENANCAGSSASRCDTSTGACTACLSSDDCAHIAGNNVCDNGLCIQCNAADDTACGNFICDPVAKQCTQVVKGTQADCQECIADEHCIDGRVCVDVTFQGKSTGRRCLWRKDAAGLPGAPGGDCTSLALFVSERAVTTVNGVQTEVCGLATTTCMGLDHFRTGGRGGDSCESQATPGEPDHTLCGSPDVNDAHCQRVSSTSDTFRCTYRCTEKDDDCKVDSTACAVADQPLLDPTTTKVCKF